MQLALLGAGLLGLATCATATLAADTRPATHYSIVERIAGPGTDWDYLTVDPIARRLYIAHNGVAVLDLNTNKLTPQLVAGKITHDVRPLGDGLVAVDDSANGMLTLFDGATGKVHATLHIPKSSTQQGFRDPDGLVIEPKTGLLIAVNADSGELVLVDLKKPSIVGTIPVGGNLETAVADGTGTLFVNSASSNEIVVVDIVNRKVMKRFPLKGCEEPTGLGLDAANHVLISVCVNGVAKFIEATTGRDVKTVAVGKEPDAVMFDSVRHLVFVPSGASGTLSVIAVRSAADIALVENVPTQVGARTGAVDLQTGRVYLPTAKFNPPTAAFPFPSAIEGTFEILVVAPK